MQKNHGCFSSAALPAIADYLSASLLGILFFPVLVFILELFARTDAAIKWQLPVLIALCVPFPCLYFLRNQTVIIKSIAVILLVSALAKALFIADLFYDTTWDSRAYHADAILLLLKDTNPLYEMMRGFDDLWTNHYPKALWYFAAIITHLTGDYNLGKSYNLILLYATVTYLFSFLRNSGISTGNALLIAAAGALSPVAISQMHSFYVDGALCSLMTLAVFSTMAMLRKPRAIDKCVFIIVSCLLINIKFTGAAYLYVIYAISACVLFYHYLKHKNPEDFQQGKMVACHMILVTLIGGILMGYNPYITNYLVHNNPLFPLVGKGSTDVVAMQNPPSFNETHTSTISRVIISAFSRSANVKDNGGTSEPEMKIPFFTDEEEISTFFANDIRIGGWGVFFSGALLLAAALYFLSSSWKNKEIAVALVCILCTILINPGSWWARYAPQVALLPLLMALPAVNSSIAWQRILAKFIFVILLLNSALIVPPNLRYFHETTQKLQGQIDDAIKTCGKGTYEISDTEGYHYEQFLEKNGIHVTYPKEDIKKSHARAELFPLSTVFLYKKGCAKHS